MDAVLGLWRLGRLGLHIVGGALEARFQFRRLDGVERHARIAAWAGRALALLRVDVRAFEVPAPGPLLIVANHVSWLDIVVIHALCPHTRFVAKADVGRWPLVRWLAAGSGTLLVDRDRPRDAARAVQFMTQALNQGQTVALFPEGTTSDGRLLLQFRSSLLQGAVSAQAAVQPLVLQYAENGRTPSPSVPYTGSTTFLQSLWRVCMAHNVVVSLSMLPAHPAPHADRRRLAQGLHKAIATALACGVDSAPLASPVLECRHSSSLVA